MRLPIINLNQEELSDFDESIKKEWLVTNGLGGYASSTVLGMNTRKYHGLLVAASHPPGDRTVCLSKLDEEIVLDNVVHRLGSNDFHGTIFPEGFKFLTEFSISPFPTYVFNVKGVKVGKTIFMLHEKNVVIVLYNILNPSFSNLTMNIFPLLTYRYFHSVISRATNPIDFVQNQNETEVELLFRSQSASVLCQATEGKFIAKPNWIERLYYREEDMRGESNLEDCYEPGYFEFFVPRKKTAKFAIITTKNDISKETRSILESTGKTNNDVECLLEQELNRHSAFLRKSYNSYPAKTVSDWLSWILLAADAFVVRGSGNRRAVIAGYHWFEPWGRDTFISLPGLMLVTGRFEDARKILLDFKGYCKHGLIPNFVEDSSGEPSYNTVDATLWFVNAVLQYLKYTGDFEFVQKNLWETIKAIVESHQKGTVFDIHVDCDGLLAHGPRLTWMDAEVDFRAVTPRAGKAVEIQALWYNTLKIGELIAKKFEETNLAEAYEVSAEKARENFNEKFWNSQKECLFDVVADSGKDASLRPNQIIALALDFSMLNNERANLIVDLVQKELVTACGLRTLARNDSNYKGVYCGNRKSRDQAYHNGTIWPWLTGPFTKAFLRAKGNNENNQNYASGTFLFPLFSQQLSRAGLGTLSEIYDGDPPHAPGGCIAQAWSVAEPLRAYIEDVMHIRPNHEKEVLQT